LTHLEDTQPLVQTRLQDRVESTVVPLSETPKPLPFKNLLPGGPGINPQTTLDETSDFELRVHPNDGLIERVGSTDNPFMTMTLPTPVPGARGPVVVMVTAEIDTSMNLSPSLTDEYVIDTRGLLTGASIISQTYTGRGTYYRRITMALVGTMNILLPNVEILKFSFKTKVIPFGLKTGDYYSVALNLAIFGQNVVSTVALFRPPVLSGLTPGESISRAKRISRFEEEPEENDFYPLTFPGAM